MKMCSAALIILTVAGYTHARDRGDYQVSGVGITSCGAFLAEVKESGERSDIAFVFVSWTQGLITGTDAARVAFDRPNVAEIPDPAAIAAYTTKWCQEHPIDTYGDASMALLMELVERGSTSAE